MAGVSAVRDLAERIGRAEVRVSEGDLQEALIVDGRTAVTWSSQSSTDESATLVTDPAAAKRSTCCSPTCGARAVRHPSTCTYGSG